MPKRGGKPQKLNALEVRARAKRVKNNIIISTHAEERMIERDICLDDIKKVFKQGVTCEPSFEKGSWKYVMKLDRHDLCCVHKVVFSFCGKNSAIIITVIDRKFKK